MNTDYNKCAEKGNRFDIRDYVEFDQNGRALCPACSPNYSNKHRTLALVPNTDGAYKCFRDCTTEEIREALGQPKTKVVPTALAKDKPKKDVTVDEKQVIKLYSDLMGLGKHSLEAIRWLANRGITTDLIKRYKLGIYRAKLKGEQERMAHAVAIPIPSYFADKYYIKKRIAPWDKEITQLDNYKPWSQYGIPPVVYFTHLPENAQETWLCEGEWDAIVLGWMVEQNQGNVAVAAFTGGCNNIPCQDWLNKLPGEIKIFYDRNDQLRKDGTRAGEEGAKKVAKALKGRAKIAQVPMPEKCTVKGWDVSDAINHGYTLESFERAAMEAEEYNKPTESSFLSRTRTLSQIFREAPDYVDWLVPDLLTTNELYCLAAPPRAGKSLLALGLAKAISSGGKFLDRQCQQGEVLYVCKEDPDDKLKQRLIAQQWEFEQMDNVLVNDDFSLDDLPELIEYIRERKPALVIMDTLTRIQKNNTIENSSEITDVLAPLQTLAQKENVCILVVHHTKKNVPKNIDFAEIFDAVRGSGAIRGTCRGMFVLAPLNQGYRLAVETGRTKPEDLKVFLDPTTLTWKLSGQYKQPPLNVSQKQLVFDELSKHKQGTIDQIHDWTAIPKQNIYTILNRLISEELVTREGRQRATTYYIKEVKQVKHVKDVFNSENAYQDCDRPQSLTEREKIPEPPKRSQNCKETLQFCDLLPDPPEKNKVVKLEPESASMAGTTGDLTVGQSLTNNGNVKLSGQKWISEEMIHFATNGDTTNFFVDSESEEEEEKAEKAKLMGVWHKELGYVYVVEDKGTELLIRRPGEKRMQTINLSDCDERREYESKDGLSPD